MSHSGNTFTSLRRQVDALMRKYARELAIYHFRPVADQIAQMWAIAVANKQPKPDPLSCIRKVVDAGYRLNTFTALRAYLKQCRRFGHLPDPQEIAERLFPSTSNRPRAEVPG